MHLSKLNPSTSNLARVQRALGAHLPNSWCVHAVIGQIERGNLSDSSNLFASDDCSIVVVAVLLPQVKQKINIYTWFAPDVNEKLISTCVCELYNLHPQLLVTQHVYQYTYLQHHSAIRSAIRGIVHDRLECWSDENSMSVYFADLTKCTPPASEHVLSPDLYLDTVKDMDASTVADIWWEHISSRLYAHQDIQTEMRTKIERLPTTCVRERETGALVAFALCEFVGTVHHLFVVEAHRKKGLGSLVELLQTQKLHSFGFTPTKVVVTENEAGMALTERTGTWHRLHHDDVAKLHVRPRVMS